MYWAVEAIFRNAGQICLAGSRLFVQDQIYDEFLKRFVATAEALVVGDPFDPATTFSALSSRKHFEKVAGYVQQIRDPVSYTHLDVYKRQSMSSPRPPARPSRRSAGPARARRSSS